MRGIGGWLKAALFPQRVACHACGAPLAASDGLLCPACRASLAECAFLPYALETVVDTDIAFAAAPFVYGGAAAALIKALKFKADHTAALPLAEGMAAAFAALPALREAAFCVPVPVHYKRQRQRGYNQAAVLAQALARMIGLDAPEDTLVRLHHKRSQVGQGSEARQKNIRGAFAVSTQGAKRVKNKPVLLIDDVLTTGSTATECAHQLLQVGASRVLLLTACRAEAFMQAEKSARGVKGREKPSVK